MNTKQIKIAGITLFIASIVILAGIIAFNGIEADEGNIPPRSGKCNTNADKRYLRENLSTC